MSQTLAEMLASGASIGPSFRLNCWGDFAINCTATGADLRPRGRKARALLAYLALHPGKPIRRERLAGLLWGDRGEEQARASLRQAIAELKTFTAAQPPLIILNREALMLDPAQLERDIDAIARAVGGDDAPVLAALSPDDDEPLFADLNDIDDDFDAWLAIERTRQADALKALLARTGPILPTPPRVPATPTTPDALVPPATSGDPAPSATVALRRWSRLAALSVAGTAVIAAVAGLTLRPTAAPATGQAPVAIAVLPFDNMAAADQDYFAQGVSEEILAQLARNPRLKVLGRTSAWSLKNEGLDATAIGRKLGVTYLVEGSVRATGGDVRIDVALVRSSDGTRLWSERYAGRLDDIFAIQDRIGAGVAARLSRNSAAGGAPGAAGHGEAYRLTLAARAMTRDMQPARTAEAIATLRRAVTINPDYAPAWAALGSALMLAQGQSNKVAGLDAAMAEARGMAQRALALDPRLAAGYRLLGATTRSLADRRGYRETAAQLDPNDAANWLDLAFLYESLGDYPRALEAFRKAVAIDPLWWPAFYHASELAWGMGFPEEAAAYVRRVEAGAVPQPFKTFMVRGDMAYRRADFSGEYAESQSALSTALPEDRYFAELGLARALRAVGRYADARRVWHFYAVDETMSRMWNGDPPDAVALDRALAQPAVGIENWDRDRFMLRTLLRAGRNNDVVRLCDTRFGSPAALEITDSFGPITQLEATAQCALGWRAAGRNAEVAAMLEAVERRSDAVLAHGRAPRWYYPYRAKLLAVMGKPDAALTALETAVGMGWFYAELWSFGDIADEPAYAGIRDTPRFRMIRAKLNADVSRERREIDAIISKNAAIRSI